MQGSFRPAMLIKKFPQFGCWDVKSFDFTPCDHCRRPWLIINHPEFADCFPWPSKRHDSRRLAGGDFRVTLLDQQQEVARLPLAHEDVPIATLQDAADAFESQHLFVVKEPATLASVRLIHERKCILTL